MFDNINIYNLQGDVTAIADESGDIVAKYQYDAWGKVLAVTNSYNMVQTSDTFIGNINPIRYRGYYYDRETGFYYLQSRYYDPEVGRFINADDTDVLELPYHNASQYNLFAYCNNNPVNDRDDDGQLSWLAKIAIGVGAVLVGAAVVAATAATGGAAAAFIGAAVAGVKAAAISGAIGAAVGAGTSAVSHRVATGSWNGAGKAALSGAIDGAADGFMWGGIAAGATFTTAAAKGIKVQQIGKLKPANKDGNGYPGVKYANKKGQVRSIEIHSPHKSGPHQQWHWQLNKWHSNGIPNGPANFVKPYKHWSLFGRSI